MTTSTNSHKVWTDEGGHVTMAGLANDTAVKPRRRQRRAWVAERLASALVT